MTQFPFSLPEPPDWLKSEAQNRLLLLLNHVLMQEPQAMERLRRHSGKTVSVHWGPVRLPLQASPAGLLALADPSAPADLRLTVMAESPWSALQAVLDGRKPPVDVQGDVLLAAEVAWLADNVRWDVEEDLARVVGDVAAYRLVQGAQALKAALDGLLRRRSATPEAH
jgi:ubiquinone biosynthesis accessory factor UbiJ